MMLIMTKSYFVRKIKVELPHPNLINPQKQDDPREQIKSFDNYDDMKQI